MYFVLPNSILVYWFNFIIRKKMFEARLPQADVWKKVVDAIKELVQEATIDCSDTGISLQAMDSAHVSLVSLLLRSDGFETFRCDRNMSLGLSISRYVFICNK